MASKKKPAVKAASPARPGKSTAARSAVPPPAPRGKPAPPAPRSAAGSRPQRPKPEASRPLAPKAEPPKPPAPRLGGPRPEDVVSRPRGRQRAARPSASPASGRAQGEVQPTMQDEGGPSAVPGLNEEDQIRAAKYLPREMPRRIFEEDRFLFPESYGVDRIRLLVRDPEWIFAYWDVSPDGMRNLGRSLGERALALSRLTLRILDPVDGGSMDILLPPGARWWYVRTDAARRTYRAELGVTLPSGEFRRIAESNTVVTPRVGPSAEAARRRLSYPEARELPLSASEAAAEADRRAGLAEKPWQPGAAPAAAEPGEAEGRTDRGGASDTFRPGGERPGASDTFRPGAGERPGASDAFRR